MVSKFRPSMRWDCDRMEDGFMMQWAQVSLQIEQQPLLASGTVVLSEGQNSFGLSFMVTGGRERYCHKQNKSRNHAVRREVECSVAVSLQSERQSLGNELAWVITTHRLRA
ncbi:Uncharacterized protein Fot_56549 [Forsythia ovata]|uniref:Uncharacterized protein n=1 Tax=Forsythia ovata TaxID=205694 RepID=A0ABD1NZU7_9LAMI